MPSYSKRGLSDKSELYKIDTLGQSITIIDHAMKGFDLGPVANKPDAVKERCVGYLKQCEMDQLMPSFVGLANYLCISKRTLYDWRRGQRTSKEVTAIINIVSQIIEEAIINTAATGQTFAPFAMFLLKCSHEYNDQPKVETEIRESVIAETSMEEVLELAESNVKTIEFVDAEKTK